MVVETLAAEGVDSVRSFDVRPSFSIKAVDGLRGTDPGTQVNSQKPISRMVKNVPVLPPATSMSNQPGDDSKLGPVLGKFVEGSGMNTIFRPRNGFTSAKEDNLLEINLTNETLQFMESSVLGAIPNRGFDNQSDITLSGIPYMQTVSDQLNKNTGLANLGNNRIDLHFEQGLFLRTPEGLKSPNILSATISRLGSIPHGTTINLQDLEPQKAISGKPVIPDIKITPTFLPGVGFTGEVEFDNMKVIGPVAETLRKPGNLTLFNKNGVITPQNLNNPNQFLQAVNDKKTIDSHFTFTLRSAHSTLKGGGVSNIAFLADGDKTSIPKSVKGNANATNVTCTYWVSTTKHQVILPPGDYTNFDPILTPTDDRDGVPGPQFQIQVKGETTQPNTINVTATQIQYSQNVQLDFGILSWPHVSVATLVPALPVQVPQSALPKLVGLLPK